MTAREIIDAQYHTDFFHGGTPMHQRVIGKDIKPAVAHIGDTPEEEIENAARSSFTALHHAASYGHHPRLWSVVKGGPHEQEYRRTVRNFRES